MGNKYGLPKPSIAEKWLYMQENNLINALERKAKPRSRRKDGFSFLKMDAEWLARFWRVYVFCPAEKEGEQVKHPITRKAIYHFLVWREFTTQDIEGCMAEKLAENMREKIIQDANPNLSFEHYRLFAKFIPSYYDRRKFRQEFSVFTRTGWTAGRK